MPPGRRTDDPHDFDARLFRADENTVRIGYKEASLSVKGIGGLIVAAVLTLGGITFYSGWQTQRAVEAGSARTEKAVEKIGQSMVAIQLITQTEHGTLERAQDRNSCILTMSPERRDRFRDKYQAGAFKQECPWVSE
jgi:hypothetical protein